MVATVNSKTVQVPSMIRESDGALLIWTTAGYRTPEEAGVVIDYSSGGGSPGGGTTAPVFDPSVGTRVMEWTAGGKPWRITLTQTGGVYVKTYNYVNGRYAGESDWIKQP